MFIYLYFIWLRCWIPNPEVPCSKTLGGSKVGSAFHLFEVNKMSTRNFWELSSLEAVEPHPQKGAIKFFYYL